MALRSAIDPADTDEVGSDTSIAAISAIELSAALDHTQDGVLMVDHHSVIVYANRPLHELLGYGTDALLGLPLSTLIPDDRRARHQHLIDRFQRDPAARPMGRDDLDLEGRRADGSSISIDVQLAPLPDGSLIVATVRDMTAQRGSTVDRAIDRLDLAAARAEVDKLRTALDVVVQRLFGLGAALEAGAADDTILRQRLDTALERIDQIIEIVRPTALLGIGRA
jgi:eukaryotic-like serine/threonine-protein kinase